MWLKVGEGLLFGVNVGVRATDEGRSRPVLDQRRAERDVQVLYVPPDA
jgi:hypothetical protein